MKALMLLLLLLVVLTGCTRWQVTDMWFTNCDPDDPAYDVAECRWFIGLKCGVTLAAHEVTLESYMACQTGLAVSELVRPPTDDGLWEVRCAW